MTGPLEDGLRLAVEFGGSIGLSQASDHIAEIGQGPRFIGPVAKLTEEIKSLLKTFGRLVVSSATPCDAAETVQRQCCPIGSTGFVVQMQCTLEMVRSGVGEPEPLVDSAEMVQSVGLADRSPLVIDRFRASQ